MKTVAVETWNPYPAVNLPELDSEHRALGAALQQLLDAMVQDDRERALALGREVVASVETHFEHEDQLMREIGYANRDRHIKIHQSFLGEAREQVDVIETRGLSGDVLRWAAHLDQWFHRHVMTEDMWLAYAVRRWRAARQASP